MPRILGWLVTAAVFCAGCPQSGTSVSASQREAIDTAVTALNEEHFEAVRKVDAERIEAILTEGVRLGIGGGLVTSREKVVAVYRDDFANLTQYEMQLEAQNVIVLTPTLATVETTGSFHAFPKEGAKQPKRSFVVTALAVKEGSSWRFDQISMSNRPATSYSARLENLKEAHKRFMKANEDVDLEAYLAFYTPDAKLYAPNQPVHSGIDALRKFAEGYEKDPNYAGATFEPQEAELFGRGRTGLTMHTAEDRYKSAGGGVRTVRSRGLHIWQVQADESWKIALDIFNEAPPPTVATKK